MHVHAIIYLSVLFVPANQSINQSINQKTKGGALYSSCNKKGGYVYWRLLNVALKLVVLIAVAKL